MPISNDALIKKINVSISTDELVTILLRLKPHEVALLQAEGDDPIQQQLRRPELEPFWEDQFNKLRVERESSFRFRDPAPQSKRDFYCGYVLYLAARKVKSVNVHQYEHYLKLSMIKFNCFYAYRELFHSLVNSIQNSTDQDQFDYVYSYVSNEASKVQRFKTPGGLLLANVYYYLATFYQNLHAREGTIVCYRACWEQLHHASLLEKVSEREIHNAYFGRGLVLSNTFNLHTIGEIQDNCLKIAKDVLSAAERCRIEDRVKASLSELSDHAESAENSSASASSIDINNLENMGVDEKDSELPRLKM